MSRSLGLFVLCIVLGGCAQAPAVQSPGGLFRDELFAAPSQRIRAEEVLFAIRPRVPGSQPRPGSIIARSTAHRPETRRNRAHFAARTRRNFLSFTKRATRYSGAATFVRCTSGRFGSRLCENSRPSSPHDDLSRLRICGESQRRCRGRYANFWTTEKSSARVFTQARSEADGLKRAAAS
jgi:hypothetical protein